MNANLARGAVALSRQRVIVKRLDAIQNLGAMDVLCTDKTGTLTQDKVSEGRGRAWGTASRGKALGRDTGVMLHIQSSSTNCWLDR